LSSTEREAAAGSPALPTALAWVVPLCVAALTLAAYLVTLTPEVGWSDSAELALQAFQLGVTHPPGYPVHAFLGKLLSLLVSDPAIGTNLLSALCASASAALACAIVLELNARWVAAAISGFFFALAPSIWDAAVVTETYTTSALFFALALLLLVRFESCPRVWRLVVAALAVALCLGSNLTNSLAVPGLLWLVWRAEPGRMKHSALFLVIAFLASALLLSWSYFRSVQLPPIGTRYVPDSPQRFLTYLSGAQSVATETHPPSFYLARVVEHLATFCRAFFWIGIPLGIVGLWLLWRSRRALCIGFLLIFAANAAYFGIYGPIRYELFAAAEYDLMLSVCYLVFSICIGCGIGFISRYDCTLPQGAVRAAQLVLLGGGILLALVGSLSDTLGIGRPGFGAAQSLLVAAGVLLGGAGLALRRTAVIRWVGANAGTIAVAALAVVIITGVAYPQLAPRLARTRSRYVTTYVLSSYDQFPEGALVAASWDKFTPLLYFQRVQGLRSDLTLIERTLGTEPLARTYDFGTVADWRTFAADSVGLRPVFVDETDEVLAAAFILEPVPHGWHRVTLKPTVDP
jgi:hypothetical protein